MCKKQTSVSHSSTESEIISLDTGLRLDGLLALELWDLIVSVLGNISRISDRTGKPVNGENKHHKSHNKIDVMEDIDAVPSNVQSKYKQRLLKNNQKQVCKNLKPRRITRFEQTGHPSKQKKTKTIHAKLFEGAVRYHQWLVPKNTEI